VVILQRRPKSDQAGTASGDELVGAAMKGFRFARKQ
jgi:hypothetical protein